ncbi:hypothetical protein LCGC14_2461350, partial [marine sediment metagenome]
MELEPNANPYVGSGVRDAAAAIEQSGLLEQSVKVDVDEPPEEQAPEEAPATPDDGEPTPEPEDTPAEAEAEPEPQEELSN